MRTGELTLSSAEAAIFHDGTAAIQANSGETVYIADAAQPISLSKQENAISNIGLQGGGSTVNIAVGATSVNAGAAGFNQTVTDDSVAGNIAFNINNGAATISGASDATHYVTINTINTASDNIKLTLSGADQNGTSQSVTDTGNDTITAAHNGVINLGNVGGLSGGAETSATNLTGAQSNILAAINAATASTGVYTFVMDTTQGAAIYETHFTGNTFDGIQLIGIAAGVSASSLVGHIA